MEGAITEEFLPVRIQLELGPILARTVNPIVVDSHFTWNRLQTRLTPLLPAICLRDDHNIDFQFEMRRTSRNRALPWSALVRMLPLNVQLNRVAVSNELKKNKAEVIFDWTSSGRQAT